MMASPVYHHVNAIEMDSYINDPTDDVVVSDDIDNFLEETASKTSAPRTTPKATSAPNTTPVLVPIAVPKLIETAYDIYRSYQDLKRSPINPSSVRTPYFLNTTEWLRCDFDGSYVTAHMSGAGSISKTHIPTGLQFDYINVKKGVNSTYSVDFSVNKRERIVMTIQGIPINTFEISVSSRLEDIQGQWYLIGTTKNQYERVFNYRACTVMTIFRHGLAKSSQFYVKLSRNLGNTTYSIVDYPITLKGKDAFTMSSIGGLMGVNVMKSHQYQTYKYRIVYFHSGRRSTYFLHISSTDNSEHYVYTDDASVIRRRERRLVERVFERYFKQIGLTKSLSVLSIDLRCYSD
jgi:hypothetical protein